MFPLGLTDILAVISAFLKFPNTILEFVKLLQKTPQEQHEGIVKSIADQAKKYEETGRPEWS